VEGGREVVLREASEDAFVMLERGRKAKKFPLTVVRGLVW